MSDALPLAAVLLVAGPILGIAPVANPSLIRIWSASRDAFIATVGAHRRGWAVLNAGFGVATVATSAGLAIFASVEADDQARGAALLAAAVAYAIGGVLWCAVLAMRTAVTPALADRIASNEATEPAESLLGAAAGGMFAAFVFITSAALVVLGVALLAGGDVAVPVALFVMVVGILAAAIQLATGDLIPAVLYVPTLVVGIALLLDWT